MPEVFLNPLPPHRHPPVFYLITPMVDVFELKTNQCISVDVSYPGHTVYLKITKDNNVVQKQFKVDTQSC